MTKKENKCSIKDVTMFIIFNVLKVCGNKTHEKEPGTIYMLEWIAKKDVDIVLDFMEYEKKSFFNRLCPIQNCFFIDDPLYLKNITEFDVILFNAYNLIPGMNLPSSRTPSQKYVLFGWEHKDGCPVSIDFNGFFNVTWSYKLKSDVSFAYIVITDKLGQVIGPKEEMHWIDIRDMKPTSKYVKRKLRNKKIAAAWIVSHCETLNKRFEYVQQLQGELAKYGHKVDIYGQCGNLECPRHERMSECFGAIETDYYFYLAFENTSKEDYVTEKLLHALEHFAVPIVYGGANYTRFMPDGIYLNARELNPKELADEMYRIIVKKKRYYDFFKWHRHYSFHGTTEDSHTAHVCDLCALINKMSERNETKVYDDIALWYNGPNVELNNTCLDKRFQIYDQIQRS